ncbi:peptide MFS transporter [candidate division KSB1 bacterium]|nr:peptide MFS transporter [candidate division KSB1 bacterium]
MWERFSFYGMRAILVLYLTRETTAANPGLGWSNARALALYGWYTMLVYAMSIPGGILADRLLGQKKTVFLGGLFIVAGQFSLAASSAGAFYAGLVLLILGVGCLKPNISTMVGGLYRANDARRDAGFTIFYIGINLGAFSAPLLVGYVGEKISWHLGFALAGIGMLLGQLVYLWGQRFLKDVGNFIRMQKTDAGEQKPLTKIEQDRILVLLISFIIVVIFWAGYEQAGGLMNLYTDQKIDRVVLGYEIPASVFQSLPALFVVLFGALVAAFWTRRQRRGKEVSALFKMAIGIMIMGSGFLMMSAAALQADSGAKAMLIWLFFAYLLQVLGELSLSPVALSFITKLAPARSASIMMGIYFAATGLGNKLAGLLGELATRAGEFEVFTLIFLFCLLIGLVLLVFFKKLSALTHGAEAIREEPAIENIALPADGRTGVKG